MHPRVNPPPPAGDVFVPKLSDLLTIMEASRERSLVRRNAYDAAKPPKGNGPATATRAYASLPPPHITQPRTIDSQELREAALRDALKRGYRDVGGLPWWAWIVAARCHNGDWRAEVRRLPRGVALRVQRAAEAGRTLFAQRSIAAVGCVICWISLRNPRACGRAQNVGGISGANIRVLTRNERHDPYSLSSIQHGNHRGAGPGCPEDGTAGFLECLRQSGALVSWIPPARAVAEFMRSNGYAFAIFRLHPEAHLYGPPTPS